MRSARTNLDITIIIPQLILDILIIYFFDSGNFFLYKTGYQMT